MHKVERIGEFIDAYQYSLGSLKYAIDGMEERLEALGDSAAVELAKKAREKQQQAVRLQYQWDQRKQNDPLSRDGTVELDGRIDRTLSSLLSAAEAFANLPEGTTKRRLADEFVDGLFPAGVYPVTSKPYDDQQTHVTQLVQQMRQEFGKHVETLSLTELVDQLEELNEKFADQLQPVNDVQYDEVESAFTDAQDAFHRLLVEVMGNYAEDMETLNEVMTPVLEQRERTRRYLKRRGTVPEVDPETGEPIESQGDGSDPSRDTDEEMDSENSSNNDE